MVDLAAFGAWVAPVQVGASVVPVDHLRELERERAPFSPSEHGRVAPAVLRALEVRDASMRPGTSRCRRHQAVLQ